MSPTPIPREHLDVLDRATSLFGSALATGLDGDCAACPGQQAAAGERDGSFGRGGHHRLLRDWGADTRDQCDHVYARRYIYGLSEVWGGG